MAADSIVISPITTKAARNAGSALRPAPVSSQSAKACSSAAAQVTPRLMPSICTIENRLLPLAARAGSRSFSVTAFIAVNCIELTPPNTAICSTRSHSGCSGVISAKAAISAPSSSVLPTSTGR